MDRETIRAYLNQKVIRKILGTYLNLHPGSWLFLFFSNQEVGLQPNLNNGTAPLTGPLSSTQAHNGMKGHAYTYTVCTYVYSFQ